MYLHMLEAILALTKKKKGKPRKHSLRKVLSNGSIHSVEANRDKVQDAPGEAAGQPLGIVTQRLNSFSIDSTYSSSRKSMINIFQENNAVVGPASFHLGNGMPPPVPSSFRAQSKGLGTSNHPPSDSLSSFPVPIQLDVMNENCTKLLSAVKSFSSLVHNHICAVVNSTILFRYEEKQTAKTLRTLKMRSDDLVMKSKSPMGGSGPFKKPRQLASSLDSGHVNELPVNNDFALHHQRIRPVRPTSIDGSRPPMIPKSGSKFLNSSSDGKGEFHTLSEVKLSHRRQQENLRPNQQARALFPPLNCG
jgi:hypothetical protein